MDDERLGRPSRFTDENHANQIKDLVLKSRHLSIRDLAIIIIWLNSINFGGPIRRQTHVPH